MAFDRREYARRYYAKNRERIIAKVKQYYRDNRDAVLAKDKEQYYARPEYYVDKASRHKSTVKAYVEELKRTTPCADCGGHFHPWVMEFDHREPGEKSFNISKAHSLPAALKEIEKCDLVCANCHRMRTYYQFQAGMFDQGRRDSGDDAPSDLTLFDVA